MIGHVTAELRGETPQLLNLGRRHALARGERHVQFNPEHSFPSRSLAALGQLPSQFETRFQEGDGFLLGGPPHGLMPGQVKVLDRLGDYSRGTIVTCQLPVMIRQLAGKQFFDRITGTRMKQRATLTE